MAPGRGRVAMDGDPAPTAPRVREWRRLAPPAPYRRPCRSANLSDFGPELQRHALGRAGPSYSPRGEFVSAVLSAAGLWTSCWGPGPFSRNRRPQLAPEATPWDQTTARRLTRSGREVNPQPTRTLPSSNRGPRMRECAHTSRRARDSARTTPHPHSAPDSIHDRSNADARGVAPLRAMDANWSRTPLRGQRCGNRCPPGWDHGAFSGGAVEQRWDCRSLAAPPTEQPTPAPCPGRPACRHIAQAPRPSFSH
jgi:hypothetical protein